MKALVTGAAGFIGRNFSVYLQSLGWGVEEVDIRSNADCLLWFRRNTFHNRGRYDLVVHAAAMGPNRKSIDQAPSYSVYNTLLDAAMFDWAIETAQPQVVYFSSSAVYPAILQGDTSSATRRRLAENDIEPTLSYSRPFDRYGEVKLHGEMLALAARECGIGVTVVRPFSGYGTDQTEDFPFGAFLRRAQRHEDPFKIWGNADQARDFIHIDDVVRGTMALVEAGVTKPVNLCTGVDTTMYDLASRMIASVALKGDYAPDIEVDKSAPMGVLHRVGDPTLLQTWYTPQVTLNEGIARAMAGRP